MLAAETWMDGDEAKTLGFATAITGTMQNAIPAEYLSKFLHVPADLLPEPEKSKNSKITEVRNTVRTA
jgi:hypothetical protein